METVSIPKETEKAFKKTLVPQFQTHYKRVIGSKDYEVNNSPSQTIPDQSLSVEELVYRYTHGQLLSGSRTPIYEEDDDLQVPADWDKMDISEKHEWLDEKREEYNKLQEKIKRDKNKLLEDEKQKQIEDAVNEKLKNIREARNPKTSDDSIAPQQP